MCSPITLFRLLDPVLDRSIGTARLNSLIQASKSFRSDSGSQQLEVDSQPAERKREVRMTR
jgi:hypothetical protein